MKKFLKLGVMFASVATMLIVGLGANGCGTAIHKASVAAASIGASLQTAATVNHDAAAAGLESADERIQIATLIDQVAKANDAFTRTLQAVSATGGQLTPANAASDFSVLVAQVDALEAQGVLHLKSPDAQAKFQVVVSSIQAQLAIIQSILASQAKASTARTGGVLSAMSVITLTAQEIEELIALAVAAGSSLVSKLLSLRGESDGQLQDDALAADAEAEKLAESDEYPA